MTTKRDQGVFTQYGYIPNTQLPHERIEMTTIQFDVIFDNGGGTTLQVGKRGFVHNYDDPAQAAQDVKVLLETGNTSDWEGNEPQCRMEYDYNTERNGGYCWHSQDDVQRIIKAGKWDRPWGYNGRKFYESLGVTFVTLLGR